MSQEDDHEAHFDKLSGIFFAFVFIMLGVFNRQVGIWLKIRIPHHRLLLITGMIIGLYYVYYKREIPVQEYVGVTGIQPIFTTLYFFICGFNIDSESLHIRQIPYNVLVIFILIALTVISVSAVTIVLFRFDFTFKECILMTILISVPDLLTTKLFVISKQSTGTTTIFSFLEHESIIGGCIASIAHALFLLNAYSETVGAALYLLRVVIFSAFGFIIGKISTAFVFKMHYDTVNQITVVLSSIFFTFSCATLAHTSGDIAVLVVGIVLMNAKPSITGDSVEMINRFIEIFRFALVCVTLMVTGIVFTVKAWSLLTWSYVLHSALVSSIIFIVRFSVVATARMIFRQNMYIETFFDVLTISFCNIRSAFNLIYIFAFLKSALNSEDDARDRLFLVAVMQIVWSFFVSTFFASYIFGIQRNEKMKAYKTEMIEDAIDVINESKDNAIKVMRTIPFRNDADWDLVDARTTLRKSFLLRHDHHNVFGRRKSVSCKVDQTQGRELAVCNILRLQKRFLEEQFRHGLLGPSSANRYAFLIKKCIQNKTFMTSKQVLRMMAPRRALQITIRDLVCHQQKQIRFDKSRSVAILLLLMLDLFLNVFFTLNEFFSLQYESGYVQPVRIGFSIFMASQSICGVFATGKTYGRTINYTLWNWLAWVFMTTSVGICLFDVFSYFDTGSHEYQSFALFIALLMFIRSSVLSVLLHPVQYLLYRITSSMLKDATFNQCDACQGYLQLMVDTHHRLESRMLDPVLEAAASEILHEENLCMRQYLGVMEVLRPNVMTALRTRISCRMVLMSQERIINSLDRGGGLDQNEVSTIKAEIRTKLKALDSFQSTVQQSSMVDVIKTVPWAVMAGINYKDLVRSCEILCFSPGDIIQSEGEENYGIMMIMNGMVRAESSVRRTLNPDRFEMGYSHRKSLFISSSFLCNSADGSHISDFYTRGNALGEFALLTRGHVHKTFRCVTTVLALGVRTASLYELMGVPVGGSLKMSKLENSLWTTVAVRQAARLLQWKATYHLLTRRQIYLLLEDAYIIDIQAEQIDLDSLKHAAVILLYGELYCPSNRMYYKAPCILPPSLIRILAQKPDTNPHQLDPSHNILLVLRSFQEMRLSNCIVPFNEYEHRSDNTTTKIETEDDLTLSSGSSVGIPCERIRISDSMKSDRNSMPCSRSSGRPKKNPSNRLTVGATSSRPSTWTIPPIAIDEYDRRFTGKLSHFDRPTRVLHKSKKEMGHSSKSNSD